MIHVTNIYLSYIFALCTRIWTGYRKVNHLCGQLQWHLHPRYELRSHQISNNENIITVICSISIWIHCCIWNEWKYLLEVDNYYLQVKNYYVIDSMEIYCEINCLWAQRQDKAHCFCCPQKLSPISWERLLVWFWDCFDQWFVPLVFEQKGWMRSPVNPLLIIWSHNLLPIRKPSWLPGS